MSFLKSLLRALAKRQAQPKQETTAQEPYPSHAGAIVRETGLPREPAIDAVLGAPDDLDAFLALPVTEQLKKISEELAALPKHELALVMGVLKAELDKPWLPMTGPQTLAYTSLADITLYGGAAGGGKTDLALGLSFCEHQRTLFCRREYGDLQAARERAFEIAGTRTGYNGQDDIFRLPNGRVIEFFAAKNPGDERRQQGQPKDLLVVDEAAHWLKSMVRYLMGWVRTTAEGQRCRVLLCTNPPTQYEEQGDGGFWLREMFAPWLDPNFPNKALPGELRWVISDEEGDDRWVNGPGEYEVEGIGMVAAKSRTFIPAKVDDNPYLIRTGYKTQLQNLDKELRDAMLLGDWYAASKDSAWQVIPTDWVDAAMARWSPIPPGAMTCLGVDVAYGGSDEMIMAARHGEWFAQPIATKGAETKDGRFVAGLIFGAMRDSCHVVLDLGGGFASEPYRHLGEMQISCEGVLGMDPSAALARDGKRGFKNKRAEMWWKFREALDPSVGSRIALPPDQKLKDDLTTPRWKPIPQGIQIEAKEEIKKRLGRSPDRGDAVVMAAMFGGIREMERAEIRRQAVTANLGHAQAKKHLRPNAPSMQPRVNLGYRQGRR